MGKNRMNRQLVVQLLTLVGVILIFFGFSVESRGDSLPHAAKSAADSTSSSQVGDAGGAAGSEQPDLFTGTLHYSMPIEAPAGRHGLQPNLELIYRSNNNSNGWIGVGWELDIQSIERNALNGIDYDGDSYVLRMSGSSNDLIYDPAAGFYRLKIEGAFYKIEKITSPVDGKSYWKVTDKTGKWFRYGYTAGSRQDDPPGDTANSAYKIYKWCLDHVEDTNGNYMSYSYIKDSGQIYLDQIDYTGNSISSMGTTNYIKFFSDNDRLDAPEMYGTDFKVVTAKRLQTIYVVGNGNPVRAYQLKYNPSASSGRNLLASVQQYGKDVAITNGAVTGGTALPAITFGWEDDSFFSSIWSGVEDGPNGIIEYPPNGRCFSGDLNGDGRTDMWCQTANNSGVWTWAISAPAGMYWTTSTHSGPRSYFTGGYGTTTCLAGDMNGDGKTDMWCETAGDSAQWQVALSTGSTWSMDTIPGPSASLVPYQCLTGDFNGDGKTDMACAISGNAWQVALSTGSTWSVSNWGGLYVADPLYASSYCFTGDLNGDGKTDILCPSGTRKWEVGLSNGNSWKMETWDGAGVIGLPSRACMTGDINGDGKTDIWCEGAPGQWEVSLSTGNSFSTKTWMGPAPVFPVGNQCMSGDLNGDGKTDMWCETGNSSGQWHYAISLGSAWATTFWEGPAATVYPPAIGVNSECTSGSRNGNGKASYWCQNTVTSGTDWKVAMGGIYFSDTLRKISNGIGGTTAITYWSSTEYPNTQLPYAIPLVWEIVKSDTNYDLNGPDMVTRYDYANGFYNITEHDFRGFGYVKVHNLTTPDNFTTEETWFHQGSSVLPIADTMPQCVQQANCKPCPPDTQCYCPCIRWEGSLLDPVAHMKGKPYRKKISTYTKSSGVILEYSDIFMTYLANDTTQSYYFSPLQQIDSHTCDPPASSCNETTAGKHVKTIYLTDAYGNITREDKYGDLDDPNDDSTITRAYGYNTPSWIIGLPTSETLYQGVGTAYQTSKTDYYYDGTYNCDTPSAGQSPTKGNLNLVCRWFNGGSSSGITFTYDDFGNQVGIRDPNGNLPYTVTYDTTFTYPVSSKNPLGHEIKTMYYGVDNALSIADPGLYGQIKSVADPNTQITTVLYDAFGRRSKVNTPTGWTNWTYNIGLPVGQQNVTMANSEGLSIVRYFDSLARTIKEEKSGPDSKTIVSETSYDVFTGNITRTSYPYLKNSATDSPRYTIYQYDRLGRITEVDYPDFSKELTCYAVGTAVTIDANGHRKKETRNIVGGLVKVEEYTGTYSNCTIEGGALYATTTYSYDVLGNLRFVTDAKGNQTEMHYDSLGRKDYMVDPDLGRWVYTYDANGNLRSQVDAKGQSIFFTYDALNRVTFKDYPSIGVHVATYTYDEAWSENAIGRLTTQADEESSTKNYYDPVGRLKKATKHLDRDYTMQYTYDYLGRFKTITYPEPDNDIIQYTYNTGGYLWQVLNSNGANYATYTDYNAFGQPGTVTFGNGVSTTYTYRLENNRLSTLLTTTNGTHAVLDLSYGYDNVGNITNLTDNTVRSFPAAHADELGSFDYGYGGSKPHAVAHNLVTGVTYTYDANGNMTNDGVRNIFYNYDNMPTSIVVGGNTTAFAYDSRGKRVSKSTSSNVTYYIDKFYECAGGACYKYIYADDNRIAHKIGASNIVYYHPDHLGSTSAMSDAAGNKIEDIQYFPFGETRLDYGLVSMSHKYTSQEYDFETGLYYYGARYYNPSLGKFISADTTVPDPENPQAFNRYSYTYNNPLIYKDPSGHDPNPFMDHWAIEIVAPLGPKTKSMSIGVGSFFNLTTVGTTEGNVRNTSANYPSSTATAGSTNNNGISGIGMQFMFGLNGSQVNMSGVGDHASSLVAGMGRSGDGGGTSNSSGGKPFSGYRNYLDNRAMGNIQSGNNAAAFIDWVGIQSSYLLPSSFYELPLIMMPVGNVGKIGIAGFTKHGLNQAINRGIAPGKILDAVRNALRVNVSVDATGRSAFEYIGREATVILNSEGKVITVHGTHSKIVEKILGGGL